MPERIETDAAEFGSRVVTEVARDKAVGGLMKRDGDDERQYPNRHIVNGDVQSIFLIGSTKSTTLSWIDRAIGPQRRAGITGEPSPDTAAGRLRASPNSFFRNPDVLGRRERVAVIQYRQHNACGRRVFPPGEQARSAWLARTCTHKTRAAFEAEADMRWSPRNFAFDPSLPLFNV